MKRTDKWLKDVYENFNTRYHEDKLPDVVVRFGSPKKGADAHWDQAKREIIVNKNLMGHDTLCYICMHHEMAHVKLDEQDYQGGAVSNDPHHGTRFHVEIDRLYKIGAYDGLL